LQRGEHGLAGWPGCKQGVVLLLFESCKKKANQNKGKHLQAESSCDTL